MMNENTELWAMIMGHHRALEVRKYQLVRGANDTYNPYKIWGTLSAAKVDRPRSDRRGPRIRH